MKISIRKPRFESFLLMFFLLLPPLRDFIFSKLPMGYWLMDALIVVMIAVCAYLNHRKPLEYIDIVILYVVLFLLFLYKFVTDSSMSVWLTREFGVRHMFIMGGIFGYGVFRVQRDTDRMLTTMKIAGIILGLYYAYKSLEVIRTGYWTYYQFGKYWKMSSNMSWSYGVLLAICLMSIFVVIDKNFFFLAPMGLGLVGIMAYGSRGTVIAFVFGAFLAVFLVNEGKLKAGNYILISCAVILVAFLFSDSGITLISSWFKAHGLNSRFLDLFNSQQTFEQASNGRAKIWEAVIKLIKEKPWLGYGVMGERNAIYALGYKWGYSHNIALEILVSFGVIFGGIIMIAFIIGIIRFFISSADKGERLIFVIYITASFELMLSSTIWLHYGLWCLLGIYANHFIGKRIEGKKNNRPKVVFKLR